MFGVKQIFLVMEPSLGLRRTLIMYFEQFGLDCPPFEETTNTAFFFEASPHRKVIDEVLHHLNSDGGMILIQGATGSGKSILGQVLMQRFCQDACVLSMSLPPSEPNQLLDRIGAGMHLRPPDSDGADKFISSFVETLVSQSESRFAVIVDNAENLCNEDLRHAETLVVAMQKAGVKFSVVLIAGTCTEAPLGAPDVSILAKPVIRATRLKRLSEEEIGEYLARRIHAAGGSPSPFTENAVKQIASASYGKPRRINEIAKLAMERAAESNLTTINDVVELGCCEDTDTVARGYQMTDRTNDSTIAHQNPERVPENPPTYTNPQMIESLVRRMEELLHNAPQRLVRLEETVQRLESRANSAVNETDTCGSSSNIEDSFLLDQTEEVSERIAHLEQTIAKASQIERRLSEQFCGFSSIEKASEEKISLLMTSLDAAQDIHNKLERSGEYVTGLVEESRQAAICEHDRLHDLFDKLSARREELGTTIDELRSERQKIIKESRESLTRELEQMRAAIREVQKESNAAIENTQSLIQETRHEHDSELEEHRKNLAQLRDEYHSACNALSAAKEQITRMSHAAHLQVETCNKQIAAASDAQSETARATEQCEAAQTQLQSVIEQANLAIQSLDAAASKASTFTSDSLETLKNLVSCGQTSIEEKIAELANITQQHETARRTAEDAVRGAKSALIQVKDSETRLAQAQQSAIDIESTAAATLCTIQGQIKRIEDTVTTVVNNGTERLKSETDIITDKVHKEIASATQTFTKLTNTATERLKAGAATVSQNGARHHRELKEEIERLAASLKQSSNAHVQEAIDTTQQCVVDLNQRADKVTEQTRIAEAQLRDIADTFEQSFKQCISESYENTTNEVQNQKDLFVSDLKRLTEEIITRINEQSDTKMSQTQQELMDISTRQTSLLRQTAAESSEQIKQRIASSKQELIDASAKQAALLRQTTAESSEQIKQQITSSKQELLQSHLEQTEQVQSKLKSVTNESQCRIQETATSAASAIKKQLASATQMSQELRELNMNGKKTLAETQTCREQVDHMIRDVWSLTSTADQRAKSLAALIDSVSATKREMDHLLAETCNQSSKLSDLIQHKDEIDELCTILAEQTDEANHAHDQLVGANSSGQKLHTQLALQAEKIGELISAAEKAITTIRSDEEKAKQTNERVKQMAAATGELEPRLLNLQQSLAHPLGLIERAQAQAEELNNVCLVVQRVFKGMSKASLEANERIKLLTKFLAASDRSANTLKQWIEEGARAHARLSDTLKQVPSLEQTHPASTITELGGELNPSRIQSISEVTQEEIDKVKTLTETKNAKSTSVSKTVVPLAEALRKGKVDSSDVNQVVDANAESVASSAHTAKPQVEGLKNRRLSADDIRKMIDEARGRAMVES